jgi:hypothetical protein
MPLEALHPKEKDCKIQCFYGQIPDSFHFMLLVASLSLKKGISVFGHFGIFSGMFAHVEKFEAAIVLHELA